MPTSGGGSAHQRSACFQVAPEAREASKRSYHNVLPLKEYVAFEAEAMDAGNEPRATAAAAAKSDLVGVDIVAAAVARERATIWGPSWAAV